MKCAAFQTEIALKEERCQRADTRPDERSRAGDDRTGCRARGCSGCGSRGPAGETGSKGCRRHAAQRAACRAPRNLANLSTGRAADGPSQRLTAQRTESAPGSGTRQRREGKARSRSGSRAFGGAGNAFADGARQRLGGGGAELPGGLLRSHMQPGGGRTFRSGLRSALELNGGQGKIGGLCGLYAARGRGRARSGSGCRPGGVPAPACRPEERNFLRRRKPLPFFRRRWYTIP